MKKLFSNATVYFTEREIAERDALIQQLYHTLKDTWESLNPAIKFMRVETPILTPADYLQGHVKEGFPMLQCERGYLRPEIAGGCFEAFFDMFPNESQRKKKLPVCIWQVGKSFREEINPDTMRASKLRLCEFWQCEFELICSIDTKADYIVDGLAALVKRFGGDVVYPNDLPHYSVKTIDWHMDGLEVAGCSVRKDIEGYLVHEISIGLDRLMAMRII